MACLILRGSLSSSCGTAQTVPTLRCGHSTVSPPQRVVPRWLTVGLRLLCCTTADGDGDVRAQHGEMDFRGLLRNRRRYPDWMGQAVRPDTSAVEYRSIACSVSEYGSEYTQHTSHPMGNGRDGSALHGTKHRTALHCSSEPNLCAALRCAAKAKQSKPQSV